MRSYMILDRPLLWFDSGQRYESIFRPPSHVKLTLKVITIEILRTQLEASHMYIA